MHRFLSQLGRVFALLLCLQLTGFLTAEAAHAHLPAAADAAAHCELCALPHLPLDTHVTPELPCVLESFAAPPSPATCRGARFVVLDRYSRPPPSSQSPYASLA